MTFAAIRIQKMGNHSDPSRICLADIALSPCVVGVKDLTEVGSVVRAHIALQDLC
jgi:hypothetical protein